VGDPQPGPANRIQGRRAPVKRRFVHILHSRLAPSHPPMRHTLAPLVTPAKRTRPCLVDLRAATGASLRPRTLRLFATSQQSTESFRVARERGGVQGMRTIALVVALVAMSAFADQDDFCAGFEEGYKSIKGEMVVVPVCPVAPVTPIGSTDFREGIKAGMRAARRGY